MALYDHCEEREEIKSKGTSVLLCYWQINDTRCFEKPLLDAPTAEYDENDKWFVP